MPRKKCRADAEFANECISSFEKDKFDRFKSMQENLESITNKLNIVRTNLLRTLINEALMEKLKPSYAMKGNGEFRWINEFRLFGLGQPRSSMNAPVTPKKLCCLACTVSPTN